MFKMDKLCEYVFVLLIGTFTGCRCYEVCARTMFEITHSCDDDQHCCGDSGLDCCDDTLTKYGIVGLVLGCVAILVLGVGLGIVIIKQVQLKRGTAFMIR